LFAAVPVNRGGGGPADMRVAGVDRDRDPLEALAASAREQGKADGLLTIQTDLTNDSAAEEIIKATRDRFGRIDVLVNNAGIGPGAIRPDSWQRPLKFHASNPFSIPSPVYARQSAVPSLDQLNSSPTGC